MLCSVVVLLYLQLQWLDQMKAVGTVWSSETVAPGDHSHPVNIRARATLADWDPARKGHHHTRLMRKQTILVLHFVFLSHNFYFYLLPFDNKMPTVWAPYFRYVADLAELPRNLEDAIKKSAIRGQDVGGCCCCYEPLLNWNRHFVSLSLWCQNTYHIKYKCTIVGR